MKINLIVIKSSDPDELAKQYELLGLQFDYHQHSTGPHHYAASMDGVTFEIYPLPKSKLHSDNTTRLGFEIEGLDNLMLKLSQSNWKIVSKPLRSEWGYTAIIEDLEGRKVELKEK
jgi:lactoylglutathione lyase